MMEFTKLLMCVAAIVTQAGGWKPATVVFEKLLQNSLALAVPAAVYFIQNTLAFFALQNIEPATFTVVSQLKLLTAAVFTVLILHRKISWRKWRALFLLILGVVLITATEATKGKAATSQGDSTLNAYAGTLATLGMVTCSGFAGIFVEKMLKSSMQLSVWDRNFQLSIYSIAFGFLQLFVYDYKELREKGFFYDYSIWTLANILIGAGGGILVAVVVKYADTIMKGFATSCAIILTTIYGHYFFGTELSHEFLIGVFVVIISLFNYSDEDQPVASHPPQVQLVERSTEGKSIV